MRINPALNIGQQFFSKNTALHALVEPENHFSSPPHVNLILDSNQKCIHFETLIKFALTVH